jgi:competence protein ComGC
MKCFIVFILLSNIKGVFKKDDHITLRPTGERIHKDIYPSALPVTSRNGARSFNKTTKVVDKETAIKKAIMEVGPKVLIYNIVKGNIELTVLDEDEAKELVKKLIELGFIGSSDDKEKNKKRKKRNAQKAVNEQPKQANENKSKKGPYKITLVKKRQKN